MSTIYRTCAGIRRRVKEQFLPHRLKTLSTNNDATAVLIATPTHGNLGDHAIVRAEKRFLADMGIVTFEVERY